MSNKNTQQQPVAESKSNTESEVPTQTHDLFGSIFFAVIHLLSIDFELSCGICGLFQDRHLFYKKRFLFLFFLICAISYFLSFWQF
jgi:hypothetical protein